MKTCSGIKTTFLYSFLFFFLSSCTYTTRQAGEWSGWGNWQQTGSRESQTVTINSRPVGARIYVDGSPAGETPATINLSYPVLRAERTKPKYERKVPGVLEHFLLAQQTTTSTISTQREEKSSTGTKTYTVEVRKEGYVPARASITLPGNNNLEFTLREKPVFAPKTFTVKNNFRLTMPERIYELLYGKRFSPDLSKFGSAKSMLSSPEAFENPLGRDAEYFIGGEIDIQRGNTEVTVTLTDRTGKTLTTRRASVETKNPDSLPSKIEALIKSITDPYLR